MITEIKSTEHIDHASFLTKSTCVLDIETDSRFWRTSHFKNVRLADTGKEIIRIPEKESDEYDLLLSLAESLSDFSSVLTFNGTGFDIPHLRKKYSAYRLADPFRDMRHDDLLRMLRKYNPLLPVERHRLNDYVSLFNDSCVPEGDAQKALLISQILNLSCLTDGNFSAQIPDPACPEKASFTEQTPDCSCPGMHTSEERSKTAFGETLSLLLTPALPLPFRIHCADGPFELASDPRSGMLSLRIRMIGDSFYLYHSDYENYDYLPGEGYAVHRSLTAYVASDRKCKASRENCYTLVPRQTLLQGSEKALKKYCRSAIDFLLSKSS